MLSRNIILILISLFLTICSTEILSQELNLLPKPQHMVVDPLKRHYLKSVDINDISITELLVDEIPNVIVNPDEAYRLHITPDSVTIEAISEKGFYWAKQTLRQLVQNNNGSYYLPCLNIIDFPAFRIRGYMHDVGRSYLTVEELKEEIEILSQYKINTFHWHLTENQGWRIESKAFPQLNDSVNFERLPGKYYTIEDAHEIAAFCKKHNMLLIPEIDMPGHSTAFVRAMGTDMQSEEGMKILKVLMNEICTVVFPDVPYIHIGTDEVKFTNPNFVPEMVSFIRSKGKKVISWNPGWNYKPGEIDMTQLWSYRGKAQPGIPAIDSRFHYINHFDAFADLFALYNSKIYNVNMGSEDIAGSILAVWNDRYIPDEKQMLLQNNFYPTMLAFAERTWLGGGNEYFDKRGTVIPNDINNTEFKEFVDFEDRMLWHKKNKMANQPFAYVKQTDIKWRITDPFPNNANLTMSFPPEKKLSDKYIFEGKTYGTKDAIGAAVYLRHVWGSIVPSFYPDPKPNHTAYAYTWVWSPKKQIVGLWASTQDYSRSEKDLAPPQGKWDYRESKIFLNNKPITPPIWENNHTILSNELSLKNENFQVRKPISVTLNKGWNKVLIKLPVGEFSSPEIRLQKWMFTFVFVTLDGKDAVKDLIYSPDKKKHNTMTKINNDMSIKWEELTTNGISGDLLKGVSATYSALIKGKLVVAGGANFPGKLGFEGGSKAYYDDILMLDTKDHDSWKAVGKLPVSSAYGVSASTDDTTYWIGGESANGSLSSSYKISIDSNENIKIDSVTSLPVTMDNFAGCGLDDVIYVAGGNINGKPGNAFYCLVTKKNEAWVELPPFPGLPRVQPVMAGVKIDDKSYIYLLGGFFGGNEVNSPKMATDIYRFSISDMAWEKVAEQLDESTQKYFSLGGATVMPVDNRYILCLGGVNYDVFLDAITSQYKINSDSTLSVEEKKKKNLDFSKNYMTQPVEYYNFNKECRLFDTHTNKWSTLISSSNTARAGATLVYDKNIFFHIQGELKPGVRSAKSFKGIIQK